MNGTLRTGNKFVLADKLTESITCPDNIELHESSSCLIVDGQVLVVALGNPWGFGGLIHKSTAEDWL